MHYLAELYTARPAWHALAPDAKADFLDRVGSAMPQLAEQGVEAIALGEIDRSVTHAAAQAFFALWRCPDKTALNALVSGIAASGWHGYFETVNAAGMGEDFTTHLAQLTALRE